MLSMQDDTESIGTIREYLCGNRTRRPKLIDMEWVYHELSKGRTKADVANELNVHPNTLYNHHKKYQAQLQALLEEREAERMNVSASVVDEDLPPIPDRFKI